MDSERSSMIGALRKLHSERKRTPISVFEFKAFLERELQSNLNGEFNRAIFAGQLQKHAALYAGILAKQKEAGAVEIAEVNPEGRGGGGDDVFEIIGSHPGSRGRGRDGEGESSLEDVLARLGAGGGRREERESDDFGSIGEDTPSDAGRGVVDRLRGAGLYQRGGYLDDSSM